MNIEVKSRKPIVKGTARTVRDRIEAGGERIWRMSDFDGLSFTAVAQTLSRLSRKGIIERLGKGMYYRSRPTVFGPSRPNLAHIRAAAILQRRIFPAGMAAANLLGFTTQNPARLEVATTANSLPRLAVGQGTLIHTRRPESWRVLSESDAALLDFLRNRGKSSELGPKETIEKLLECFREPGRFDRLAKVALTEPPRVQAILGAVGQQLGLPQKRLAGLRRSLNALSRFDFGNFAILAYSRQWQAKEHKPGEAV